jgi:hypothetical protein
VGRRRKSPLFLLLLEEEGEGGEQLEHTGGEEKWNHWRVRVREREGGGGREGEGEGEGGEQPDRTISQRINHAMSQGGELSWHSMSQGGELSWQGGELSWHSSNHTIILLFLVVERCAEVPEPKA